VSRLTVNGQPVHYRMDPQTPLLWALRDASNLTGTKYGCGTGECGACTVHIDGAAALSCQVSIAQIEGSLVTTIEGLPGGRDHPVARAFIAAQVPQCGFCIPGMIMASAALLAKNPRPSDADMDAALTNICRCGVYPRLRAALRQVGGG
jgi:isoquinoline 1-oxidoreductase alpha subunit